MAVEKREIGYTFPYLFDATQDVARAYRAACTPDFFLFGADRRLAYRDVQALASQFGNVLRGLGVQPEQRVLIALPDGPEFVGALFGVLKIGAVVVMVNPGLKPDDVAYFFEYTRARIAVVHADGTGRIQIVREADDPLIHAYLKAMGRRVGVEMSVNTSFNVAGPIAQTPQHAIDTLRRSKGLDVVLMVADDGTVHAAWHGGERDSGRFTGWLAEWRKARAS